MVTPLVLAALALAAGGAVIAAASSARRTTAIWLEAAREAGLRGPNATGIVSPGIFAMTSDGMGVTVARHPTLLEPSIQLTLEGPGRLPDELVLGQADRAAAALHGLRRTEVTTGDRDFDARVRVYGPEPHLVTVLDRTTRQAVLDLVEDGLTVAIGQAVLTLRGDPRDRAHLAEGLRRLVEVAQRLQAPADTAQRLADTARHDPVAEMRRRALELLLARFPRHECVAPTLRAVLADRHPAVRLLAARRLGAEGVPVLVQLAMTRGTPEPVAAEAARAAGAALGTERAGQLLDRGLAARLPRLALAAVEALGACADEAACARLAELRHGPEAALAAAAVTALATARGPAAEEDLVEALADEWREVRLAAVEGLGRVGTVRSVGALREAATAGRDGELRRAAAAAVAAIQTRTPGAGRGQLSLAVGAGGELAMAGEDLGRVSLVDEG